jgi:predicted nucleic acid-binding protein
VTEPSRVYFDTSYLVRLYFRDPGWETVREMAATDHLACAIHGRAEMIAAFHRKLRDGAIRPVQYAALLDQAAADDAEEAIRWVPLSPATLTKVAAVYAALPASIFLRAADALHLATAAEQGLTTIYSNDHHLLAAARHFGLSGRNVIPTGL